MAVAIVALLITRLVSHPPAPGLVRFSITAPEGEHIHTDSPSPAISPDGRRLVFTVLDSVGNSRLWIRPLDSSSAQPIAGTEGASLPFWSPDSRFIAFFAEGKLRKVPAAGGPPETICDVPDGRGGTWSKDGVIVFAPLAAGPLQRVSSEGGEVVTVARPDSARGETGLRFPCFLPDGRHFLYASMPRRQGLFDVYVGDLESRKARRVMTAGSAVVYAEPGYLLFERNGRIVAQWFDHFSLRPTGRLVPLDDAPPTTGYECAPPLCAPAQGVLVHVAVATPNTQLKWFDRAGRPTGTVPLPPGRYESPSLSPDGRRAAVTKRSAVSAGDLWTVDLERAFPSRLTFDGLVESPLAWSPDGSHIAFIYNPSGGSGTYNFYQVLASGTGRPEPLLQSSVVNKGLLGWTPDGKHFVYFQIDEGTGWDIWLLPLEGERKPLPYLRSPSNQYPLDISPDGRWLAYSSDETGRSEIYVRSFPEPGESHRITTSGGTAAHWSRDGRELLVLAGNSIYSVGVRTAPTFQAGTPRLLFTPRPDVVDLAVTRDHKRFLAVVPVGGAAPPSIAVILNWQEALKR